MLQTNLVSGLPYQGRNQLALLMTKNKNNYKSDKWLTFVQARNNNRKVLKGSKATSIFKGFRNVIDKKTGKSKSRPSGFANLFNLDQTELIKK